MKSSMPSSILTSRRLGVILFAAILTFLYCRGLKVGQNTANEIRLKSQLFATTTINSDTTDDIDVNSTPRLRSGNISAKQAGSFNDIIKIPSCAQQVYITLQRDDDDKTLPPCHGLLIRDDLIITTYKCSKHTYIFHFSGLKKSLKATPHTEFNNQIAQQLLGREQELGILYTDPPYHYYYINQPVRRTSMFLSEISHHANGTEAFLTCNNNKPIAHSFPSDNGEKLIPLSILKDILPSDILWESTDLNTAVTLSYKQYNWYTKPTTQKYEKIEIKNLIKQYCRGPPGSVAFCNGKRYDFNDAAAEAMEALDPRGHRRDCWPYYYDKWFYQEPFSGMKFLDWLGK